MNPASRQNALYTRRDLVRLFATAAATLWVGCKSRRPRVTISKTIPAGPQAFAAEILSCIVRPAQTEGPYFVDSRLNRADIRSDPADGSVRPGSPLRLVFHVSRADGRTCTPLAGAIVDVWHCDAAGVYSDVRDPSFDTRGKKFLRGYQVTSRDGVAEFATIYPGWYHGRAVHVHFKIRTDAGAAGRDFTSQLYFDEAITDRVHSESPYKQHGHRTMRNEDDFIYRQGGKQLMAVVTRDSTGYRGDFSIGLQLS